MALATDVRNQAATADTSPVVSTLPLAHSKAWRLHVHNTDGAANITAIRLRRRTHAAGPSSAWVSVAAGLPLAPGAVLAVVPDSEDCAQELDVELTADADGATAALWLAGTR